MSSCISSCARRCSLSRSRRSRTPSTKMSARRASFSPRDKAKQRKRVKEKSKRKRHADGVPFLRPSGAISCRILPSAKQAGQALRRAPRKNLQESRGVNLTFLPLPAPQRRGLVRCADERGGYRFRFLRNRKRIQGGQRPPWKKARRHGKRPPAFTDGLFHKE